MQAATDALVYFNIIWKRLWLTILLVLVTVGTILSLSYTARPVYRATVRLQVLATDRSDISLFSQTRSSSSESEIQQAQSDFIRALKMGFVAWKTVADLNLEIGAMDLLEGLNTAIEGDFIIVTVESDDPGRAEATVTTQVNNALEYYRGVRGTPSRVLGEFVSTLLEAEQKNMLDAESAVLKFKEQHSLDSIEQETRALQDLIRSQKTEREQAVMERDRNDIFARVYRAEEAKADQKADELAATTTQEGEASSPNTTKFYRDLARQHEATAIGYEARRDGYTRSIELYDEVIAERTEEIKKLLGLYSEYNALQRSVGRSTGNYNFLMDRVNEAHLKQAQAEEMGYIQIVEAARKPDAPVPSKTPQLAAVGGVVSVLIGFVLSFLIEFIGALRKAARKQRVD